MKTLKVLTIIFAAGIAVACIVVLMQFYITGIAVPAPPTVEQRVIDACENWTRDHSSLAVDKFVSEARIADKDPHLYKVVVRYRSKGPGLLMTATCEYIDANGKGQLILTKAKSKPAM
jgi:hypothetical protein